MTKDKTTFEDERTGTGTKEWSNFSYNICKGCEHGCLYCYAKAQACRFDKPMRIPGQWNRQKLNPTRRALGAEVGAKGVVMFPTSHDITPRFLRHRKRGFRSPAAGHGLRSPPSGRCRHCNGCGLISPCHEPRSKSRPGLKPAMTPSERLDRGLKNHRKQGRGSTSRAPSAPETPRDRPTGRQTLAGPGRARPQ